MLRRLLWIDDFSCLFLHTIILSIQFINACSISFSLYTKLQWLNKNHPYSSYPYLNGVESMFMLYFRCWPSNLIPIILSYIAIQKWLMIHLSIDQCLDLVLIPTFYRCSMIKKSIIGRHSHYDSYLD